MPPGAPNGPNPSAAYGIAWLASVRPPLSSHARAPSLRLLACSLWSYNLSARGFGPLPLGPRPRGWCVMLVSLRALPAWVGGGLLADLHQASPSTACAPAASVSAPPGPIRRGRVGARAAARAVLGVLWRDGLCVLAMPRGSHVVCASGHLSHWIQQVKEKETDTPRKTPGGGTPRSDRAS